MQPTNVTQGVVLKVLSLGSSSSSSNGSKQPPPRAPRPDHPAADVQVEADAQVKQESTQDTDAEGEEEEDDGVIRCICAYTHDDGFTIQCERCLVWQHAVCVNISKNNVPDEYYCEQCHPRPGLSADHAQAVQRKRLLKNSVGSPPSSSMKGKSKSAAAASGGGGAVEVEQDGAAAGGKATTASSSTPNLHGLSSPSGGAIQTTALGLSDGQLQALSARRRDSDVSDVYNEFDDLIEDFVPSSRLDLADGLDWAMIKFREDDAPEDMAVDLPALADLISLQRRDLAGGVAVLCAVSVPRGRLHAVSGRLIAASQVSDDRFVFPIANSVDHCLDCRRWGNELRFVRMVDSQSASCKLVLSRANEDEVTCWLVALDDLSPGSELSIARPQLSGDHRMLDVAMPADRNTISPMQESERRQRKQQSSHRLSVTIADSRKRVANPANVLGPHVTNISQISIPFDGKPRNIKKSWLDNYRVDHPNSPLSIQLEVEDDDSEGEDESGEEETGKLQVVASGLAPLLVDTEILSPTSLKKKLLDAAQITLTSSTDDLTSVTTAADVAEESAARKRPAQEEPVTRISLKDYKKKRKLMNESPPITPLPISDSPPSQSTRS
eukprot:Partr_v1_DN26551_c0_g1_i1_m3802 putative PHD finger and SET domain protein